MPEVEDNMGMFDSDAWYIVILTEYSTKEYRKSVVVYSTSYENAISEVFKDFDNKTRDVVDVFYCGQIKPQIFP